MRETVKIMRYPVTLTPAPEGGYVVSFVDIPEALTQGETVAEAMEAAKDALITAFDFYFEDNELIPLPSPLNNNDHFIEVPLSVASKVLLLNAFCSQKSPSKNWRSELVNLSRRSPACLIYITRRKLTPSSLRLKHWAKSYRW